MKMKLAWIISCLSVIVVCSTAQAQQNMVSVQYSVGFPLGNLNDYIGQTSFRGIGIDYEYMTATNLAFGLDAGINTFYERKGYDTYQEGTVSITGTQYRYTNSFPLMASVGYYLWPEQALKPYASLGVGTLYTLRNTDIGFYRSEVSAWQFSLRPEVGVIFQLTSKLGIKVAGKYFQAFETSELEEQSYAAAEVGLVFTGNR